MSLFDARYSRLSLEAKIDYLHEIASRSQADPDIIRPCASEIIRLDPTDSGAYILMSHAALNAEEEETLLKEAVRLVDARWLPTIAGKTDEPFFPGNYNCREYTSAHRYLAMFDLRSGREQATIDRGLKMIEIGKSSAGVGRYVAIAYANLGRYEEAEAFITGYKTLLGDGGSFDFDYTLLLCAHMRGKDTSDLLSKALRANSDVVGALSLSSYHPHEWYDTCSTKNAERYLAFAAPGWKQTGADKWLIEETKTLATKRKKRSPKRLT